MTPENKSPTQAIEITEVEKRAKERRLKALANRARQLSIAIATLEREISATEAEGEIAQPSCTVDPYLARGSSGRYYHYYKFQAATAVFQSREPNKMTRYQHLGRAGTTRHIEGVMSVLRRDKIRVLSETVNNLKEALLKVEEEIDQENGAKPEPDSAVLGGM